MAQHIAVCSWAESCRDRVVLAAGDVSEYAILTLEADGWIVRQVQAVRNPSMRDDGKYPARFWAVYSKLHVFGLTEYDKGEHCVPWLRLSCACVSQWHALKLYGTCSYLPRCRHHRNSQNRRSIWLPRLLCHTEALRALQLWCHGNLTIERSV
jgi:hypothetical protein